MGKLACTITLTSPGARQISVTKRAKIDTKDILAYSLIFFCHQRLTNGVNFLLKNVLYTTLASSPLK